MSEPTRLYIESRERDERIRQLELDTGESDDARFGLLEVVKAMVAGRASSTDNNARSSAGYNAWDYGVRRLREVYRGFVNWQKYEEEGVEGIVNHHIRVKITVVSTDSACDPSYSPRNRTPKGAATEKIIDLSAQGYFFPPRPKSTDDEGYSFWELCVADDGNDVTAELSKPILFESSYFLKFSERIFLITPGEWKEINIGTSDSDVPNIEPDVRRK